MPSNFCDIKSVVDISVIFSTPREKRWSRTEKVLMNLRQQIGAYFIPIHTKACLFQREY